MLKILQENSLAVFFGVSEIGSKQLASNGKAKESIQKMVEEKRVKEEVEKARKKPVEHTH